MFSKIIDTITSSKTVKTVSLFNRSLTASSRAASVLAFTLSTVRAMAQIVTPLTMAQLAQAVAEDDDEIIVFPGLTDHYPLTQAQLVWTYVGLQAGIWAFTPLIQFINDRVQMVMINSLTKEVLEQTVLLSQEQIEELENNPDTRVSPNIRRIFEDGNYVFEMLITSFLTEIIEVVLANALVFWQLGWIQGVAFSGFSVASLVCDHLTATHLDTSTGRFINKIYSIYDETISALKTIRVAGNNVLQNRLLLTAAQEFRRLQTKVNDASQISIGTKNIAASIAIAIYISTLIRDLRIDKNEIDDLIFLLGYINRFVSLLANIDRNFLNLQSRMENFTKLHAFLKISSNDDLEQLTAEDIQNANNSVVMLNNCSFQFANNPRTILENVNLNLNLNEYCALVGRSGEGKTTLLQLLLGFYTPQANTEDSVIKVFNKDLSSIDRRTYYPYVGWVSQAPEALTGSFRYNVLIAYYGEKLALIDPDSDDAEEKYNEIYKVMLHPLMEEVVLEDAAIQAQLYKQLCHYYTLLANLYIENSVVAPANKIYQHLIASSNTRFVTPKIWDGWLKAEESSETYSELVKEVFNEYQANIIKKDNKNLYLKYLIVPICVIDPSDNSDRMPTHQWQALIFSFSKQDVSSSNRNSIEPSGQSMNKVGKEEVGEAVWRVTILQSDNNLQIVDQELQVDIPDRDTIKLLHTTKNIEAIQLTNIREYKDYNCELLFMMISLHNHVATLLDENFKSQVATRCQLNYRQWKKIKAFGEYKFPEKSETNHIEEAAAFLEKYIKPDDLFILDMSPLSGGEMQRVGAARVFAKKQLKLLLLDEPTSALDAFTEAELVKNYKEKIKGIATLGISHRLFTIKDATKIGWVKEGIIDESKFNTHERLLEADEDYKRAWQLQHG